MISAESWSTDCSDAKTIMPAWSAAPESTNVPMVKLALVWKGLFFSLSKSSVHFSLRKNNHFFMTYNVYKHISAEQFKMTQARLSVINNIILQRFRDKLKHLHRADESDYLVLNFSFLGQERFLGNLAIMFEDRPELITFDLIVIKTLDEDGFRYYKRVKMVENMTLPNLEQNIEDLCSNAIQTYYSWSEKEVKENSTPL